MKKIILLFIGLTLCYINSYSQQIILIEKDSLNNYHFKDLNNNCWDKIGYNALNEDSFYPTKYEVYNDSIVAIERKNIYNLNQPKTIIRKSIYKMVNGKLTSIRIINSKYIESQSGYYLFDDGEHVY